LGEQRRVVLNHGWCSPRSTYGNPIDSSSATSSRSASSARTSSSPIRTTSGYASVMMYAAPPKGMQGPEFQVICRILYRYDYPETQTTPARRLRGGTVRVSDSGV